MSDFIQLLWDWVRDGYKLLNNIRIEFIHKVSDFIQLIWDWVRDGYKLLSDIKVGFASTVDNWIAQIQHWVAAGVKIAVRFVEGFIPDWLKKLLGLTSSSGGASRDFGAKIGAITPTLAGSPLARTATGEMQTGGQTINIIFNAPVYGLSDFEDRIAQAVRNVSRHGGFGGALSFR